jgi:hypothetical protein
MDCFDVRVSSFQNGKWIKLDHLEEVKVVTRFP